MAILKLDESITRKVDSLLVITSLGDVVAELLKNSVDANATQVSVWLDLQSFSVQVDDNGDGVSGEDMKVIAGKHCTSRRLSARSDRQNNVEEEPESWEAGGEGVGAASSSDNARDATAAPTGANRHIFGYKGISLYAISSLGILKVRSNGKSEVGGAVAGGSNAYRGSDEQQASSISVRVFNGKREYADNNASQLSESTGRTASRFGATTSVSVSGLFANVPVRRAQVEATPEHRHLESIRSKVLQVLVASPPLDLQIWRIDSAGNKLKLLEVSAPSEATDESDSESESEHGSGPESEGKSHCSFFGKYANVFSSVYGDEAFDPTSPSAQFFKVCHPFSLQKASQTQGIVQGIVSKAATRKRYHFFFHNGTPLLLNDHDSRRICKVFNEDISSSAGQAVSYPVIILNLIFPDGREPSEMRASRTSEYDLYVKAILAALQKNMKQLAVSWRKSQTVSPSKQARSAGSRRGIEKLTSPIRKLQVQSLPRTAAPVTSEKLQSYLVVRPQLANSSTPSSEHTQGNSEWPDSPASESEEHFCSHPSSPPSVDLAVSRLHLKEGSFRVIRQLDRKFILLTISGPASVVAVDQHACDERIRVEALYQQLLADLFNEDNNLAVPLEAPVDLPVTIEETESFHAHRASFAVWGVGYTTGTSPPVLTVTHLPLLLIHKLAAISTDGPEGDPFSSAAPNPASNELLLGWLAQYVHELEAKEKLPLSRALPWHENLSRLPQVLVDIVNMKACRSSIMFGTELSMDEMSHLVSSLGRCKFPFQCAHGRPSVVGLADLEGRTS